jgi:two-component system, chemotaxis family, chemotaxis protein CheY
MILLVDDHPDIRESLSDLLEAIGFRVTTAADGRAGLEYLRSHAAPAVILLDLMMPGMDGAEFRRRQLLDPALAAIPVILCSGVNDLEIHAERLGRLVWLRKPFPVDQLLGALRRYTEPEATETPIVGRKFGSVRSAALSY